MQMARYQQQHVDILTTIKRMRAHSQQGVAQHADDIAADVVALYTKVKLHLSVEDRVLYPAIDRMHDASISNLAHALHEEMDGLAARFIVFSRRWMRAGAIAAQPDDFRAEANVVLRALHKRIQKENVHFYPRLAA